MDSSPSRPFPASQPHPHPPPSVRASAQLRMEGGRRKLDSDEDLGRFEMETLTFERASGWGRGKAGREGAVPCLSPGRRLFGRRLISVLAANRGGREGERAGEREGGGVESDGGEKGVEGGRRARGEAICSRRAKNATIIAVES